VRIAVVGTGGVGGYFGGKLARSGEDVGFLARGEHLRALQQRGLRVRSPLGDFETPVVATDDPAVIGPCDYVLFCVKSFDTQDAAALLPPLLGPDTAVVSLQNGIDNEEAIADRIGWAHVMGGVAFIFSSIVEPGVIEHTSRVARLVVGEWEGEESERALKLVEAFKRAEVEAEVSSDIRAVLWNKFAFICAQAGMTAATQLPIGDIRADPDAWSMFRAMVEEVAAVAAAEGVDLGPGAVDRHVAFAESLDPDGRSSLYHDLSHGRRMEVEALHGTVVRLASKHGIPAPASRAVYSLLRPWAAKNERATRGAPRTP
jgi:2-dehydropantoate 2-reductase